MTAEDAFFRVAASHRFALHVGSRFMRYGNGDAW
jgi:hypothetical protein